MADTLAPLIDKIGKGDRVSFTQLYEETSPRIRFFLIRMLGNIAVVDDVLVETYTSIWQGASRFSGKSRVLTWMFAIARNQALKEMRKNKKHKSLDEVAEPVAPEVREHELSDQAQVIRRALLTLSGKHQQILELSFFNDLSYPEIGELLEIPVNTVKTRVFHAKKALAKSLKHMSIDRHDL